MDTTSDAFLTGLITTAQSDLDSEIGYMFQQDGTGGSPATRLYDGDGTYSLWTEDIVSVATVIETATVTYLATEDRKSTRLNSSHQIISYAVFCLKKKKHCNDYHIEIITGILYKFIA